MSRDQTAEYALSGEEPSELGRATASHERIHLTARERQVLSLVSLGLSNREIAARLVISVGTTKRHIENILAKLGLDSRTKVAAWALQHPALL